MSRRPAGGFTLLEMMVAMSILALSMMWLIEATTRAIEAENHAKLLTTATFLARQQMVDLEDTLQEKGMTDDSFASEKTGDFKEDGFPRFRWKVFVDKIQMPGQDAVQSALGAATGAGGGGLGTPTPDPNAAGGGAAGLAGMAGGAGGSLFTSQFGLIKDVLESGIRKATVTVAWTEHGDEKVVEVVQFLTDPRRVDQSVSMGAIGNIPMPGGPAPTTPTTPSGPGR